MARTRIDHVDVITLDEADRVLRDVTIAVDGSRIVALGAAPESFLADEVVDGRGQLALPGLFNAHCHAAMTLVRGWAEDLPFPRWLNERVWVAESALEQEDVYWGAALAACEMIRSGTVGFADHYFWMDEVARMVADSGLKALLAWCYFGLGPAREVGGTDFGTIAAFVHDWNGAAEGRIRTAFGPHSPYMCSPAVLQSLSEAARAAGCPVHLHLAESDEQVRASMERHGRSPVAHLAALGVLEGPTIAAHCIAVDDHDVDLLAQHGVCVAHTPKTYLKLAMGMPPLARLLGAGVKVALGTDGPASNADLNLLEVMRLVGLLQKQAGCNAAAMPIGQILKLATAAGAAALGFPSSGVIRAGAAADLLLLDTTGPHWAPWHDDAATVVYGSHPSDVSHLFVDGRMLLRKGELLTLDEERIVHEASRRAARMVGAPMTQLRRYQP
jgi:5-methylthioadenosine/S-adenosylhomocysteine deaminase